MGLSPKLGEQSHNDDDDVDVGSDDKSDVDIDDYDCDALSMPLRRHFAICANYVDFEHAALKMCGIQILYKTCRRKSAKIMYTQAKNKCYTEVKWNFSQTENMHNSVSRETRS